MDYGKNQYPYFHNQGSNQPNNFQYNRGMNNDPNNILYPTHYNYGDYFRGRVGLLPDPNLQNYNDVENGRWVSPIDTRPQHRQIVVFPEQEEIAIERSFTPTFEGSGPLLLPDENHDEIRPVVAYCLTPSQLNNNFILQDALDKLNLLSGTMQDIVVGTERPGADKDTFRTFPSKAMDQPSRNIGGSNEDKTIIVNTSNKLIRKPKNIIEENNETVNQSSDVLVVDSSKQNLRTLTAWVPKINSKRRKVENISSTSDFQLISNIERPTTQSNIHVGSKSVISQQIEIAADNSIQWFDNRLVMPKVIKMEPEEPVSNTACVSITQENFPRNSVMPFRNDQSAGSSNLTDFDSNRTTSTVVRTSANKNDENVNIGEGSLDRPKTEMTNMSKGLYSLRIIRGQRIPGDSRICYSFIEGKCISGIFCRFDHSGMVKKACSRLLRGLCRPDNDDCSAAHSSLLPHQFPVCSFFLRGDCSVGTSCTLLHVKHAPETPFCVDFGKGSCLKGIDCEYVHAYQRHVIKGYEDFATVNNEDEDNQVQNDREKGILNWIEG